MILGIAVMAHVKICNGLFLYLPVFILIVGAVKLLERTWQLIIFAQEEKRNVAEDECKVLQERLNKKEKTLKNLDTQVNDIIDLFEVAKFLNACLHIDEIIDTLERKVLQHLYCRNATLLLLGDDMEHDFEYTVYTFSDMNERVIVETDEELSAEDARKYTVYIKKCLETQTVIRIDYPIQFNEYFNLGMDEKAQTPFWLFPLCVENKVIAIFLVHGAIVNDFSKFSIIAAQLALQIKKIKLYSDVRELSITDGLTNVFLRRHFLERFESELKRSINYKHTLCVLMIDIDHFKEYNDNFGHLVGDVTLKEVVNAIKENVRKVDLVGRYGGEEFIVVLPETDKMGGVDAAERIRSAIEQKPLKVFDEETRITISVGVSAFPDDSESGYDGSAEHLVGEMILKADQCLYVAKNDGRNRVVSL